MSHAGAVDRKKGLTEAPEKAGEELGEEEG